MLYKFKNYCVASRRYYARAYASSTTLVIKSELPGGAYRPELVEKYRYEQWEKEGLFKPEPKSHKPNFSMVLPPPNVTGKLHLGHALGCTIQDVILRRKRALGHNTVWIPGTDHAGIATQGVVEKYLLHTKNINRYYLGRNSFVNEVWKWKDKHGDTIMQQLRNLGCSLDWSRQLFTMDQRHTNAVNIAFKRLYNKGLIYRKQALINWCGLLKSTVSDMEIKDIEISGPTDMKLPGMTTPVTFGQLYRFAYKIFGTNDEVVVATTMPETMMGDVAIAVHPHDTRYKHLIGKRVYHPFKQSTLPIIYDEFVNMDFGTGAVKITPAHSKVDYEVAKRHNLPLIQVIDENGAMMNAERFTGMPRYECREQLIKGLDEFGFMRGIEPHRMTLPSCSRTGMLIEYLPKEQWFVNCGALNRKAREVVESGLLRIEPEKYVKNWIDWCNDERDWCISRQIWWGHQIPAYKCTVDDHEIWVVADNEEQARIQASRKFQSLPEQVVVERDEDVLDTWFSSGIYPFAAMGWPDVTDDLKKFYPLSMMVTGHDILGFWIHRMILLGMELTGQLPFNQVLLHGVICDHKGAKMSKSKGNVIDPVDVINGISLEKLQKKSEQMLTNGILSHDELKSALAYQKANFTNTSGIPECGVDALRFSLLTQDVKSHFVNFDVNVCHANKLFCNKIWQSIKYVQMCCSKLPLIQNEITPLDLTYFDKWILSRLSDTVDKVNQSMDNNDFHLATKALRNHIYNEFCDVYLEATKPGFGDNNPITGYAHAHTLTAVLNTALRCLHPYMIYLTEELIPKIPAFEHNIICNYHDDPKCFDFPEFKDFKNWRDEKLENRASRVLEATALIRELKGLCGMSHKLRPAIHVKTNDATLQSDLANNILIVSNLARCCAVNFEETDHRYYIRGLLDKESEVWVEVLGNNVEKAILGAKLKLQHKIEKLERTLLALEKQYSTDKYVSTEPEWTKSVDRERLMSKREELRQMQQDLGRIIFDKDKDN
ncbi:uncharacterized protein LOC126378042 [Pectinophora gossypiella]|uniref:uncharacterized protein LOC126378042 n=1 Tax=Pectinophora gossypiella TaxID=13191 RepID=UPI00214E346F|nr:uncharacterized protein LOC126378042 [Pectinophora gossypiella]